MSHSNSHPKTAIPSDKDLRENPGIGGSKGTIKAGDEDIEDGANTFEGDTANDTDYSHAVDSKHMGRTNK